MMNVLSAVQSLYKTYSPSGLMDQFRKPTGKIGWLIGQVMASKNKERSQWVLSLLKVQPDDQILEIGFGPGTDIQRVSQHASRGFVAGIDYAEIMVCQARKRNAAAIRAGKVNLQCATASKLPYDDQSFDTVFSINVAQFWDQPLQVLAEVQRVLKLGGLVALAVQPRNQGATEETVRAVGKQLVKHLTDAGFQQIRLETKSLKPVSVVCALGIKND
jgi:ubiquinone/menaquinone biosynthesis C-methylase UbiE